MSVVDAGVPDPLVAGTRVRIPLVLRNDGSDSWTSEAGYAVSYHWRDAQGEVVVWDGVRTALPAPVLGGATLGLDAELDVPEPPGGYLLQWDVVQEGVRWLSEVDPAPPRSIEVSVRIGHSFTVTGGGRVRWLAPSAETVVPVRLRNDGSITWRADRGFALSYHWFTADGQVVVWDGVRTRLPVPVAAGGSVAVDAVVRAPERPGWYRIQLDMVEEGVTWFSQRDPTPEPRRRAMVAAFPRVTPARWAVTAVAIAMLALVAVRSGASRRLLALAAMPDLLWCAGSLAVKQAAVLDAAGQSLSVAGWLLTWAGVALVLLVLLLVPRAARPWASLSVAAAGTALLFADLVYERFFGDILSLAVVGAAGQVAQVRASVWSLLRWSDAWMWADLAAGVVLVLVARGVPSVDGGRARRVLAGLMLAVVGLGGAAGLTLVRASSGVLDQVFRNLFVAREVGVLNFHAYDLARQLGRVLLRPRPTDREIEEVVAWFADTAGQRAGAGRWFGAARGLNLLMVQVESLQGFVVGLEVNGQPITPQLNRLADRSAVFQLTDQTALGRSSDSELATQVSLLPPARGAAAFLYARNDFTGLAAILGGHGYHTVSAVPFDGGFWNRQLTHPAYGYRLSLFGPDFGPGEAIGWGLNDRAFFGQMVERLEALPRPFCAWLLTLGLHHPFEGFPDRHKVLRLGAWEGTPFGDFLHTMSFFDRALGELIAGLERSGLARSTVLVLWGDHDAGLEWQPELARTAGRSFDGAGWYLSQRVPLVIHLPGQPELAGQGAAAAGHQDVAPTVLALLGVDPARYAFIGRNLLGEPGGSPVVGEYHCWQDGSHVFLQRGASLADGECYDLATMERVPVAQCGAGWTDAQRQVEISRLVLEHDLQRLVHLRLQADEGSEP